MACALDLSSLAAHHRPHMRATPATEKTLEEIEATGTVRDVSALAARYEQPDWAQARRALEGVLSRARARDLIWLEANARHTLGAYQYYGSPWQGLQATQVSRLAPAAVRLATFHGIGWVREAAVRALASTQDPDVLPYLLLRANDWVDEVSRCARGALDLRLRPADAAAWIAVLPFERHVRALRRRSLAYLFDRAKVLLAHPDARPAVREQLESGPTDVRRACAALAASFPPAERASLLLGTVRDPDAIVAATAATGLLQAAGPELRDAIGALLVHRVAKVRLQALAALWASFPAEATDRTRDALFDPARCVRELAQFELRRRHAIDPAPIYAAALAGAQRGRLLATIAGLGECGSAQQHAALVAPYLASASRRVQLEALRALRRLDADTYATAFLDALRSPSGRIFNLARETLKKRAHLVDRAKLEAVAAAGGAPARVALQLLYGLDSWVALLALLRAVARADTRELALGLVAGVLNRPFNSAPSDHAALERALDAVRAELPEARRFEKLSMAQRIDELLGQTRPRG
jgi:hypothetical protein